MATELAQNMAERGHMNQQLLIALANAVAANEETQRRFRTVVLIRLSRIETMLTEIQGAQLVQLWHPDRVCKDQRTKWVQEVQERVEGASNEMGLKMVKFIYGESEQLGRPGARRGKWRKWSDWEI
jgi:hypothetical protein